MSQMLRLFIGAPKVASSTELAQTPTMGANNRVDIATKNAEIIPKRGLEAAKATNAALTQRTGMHKLNRFKIAVTASAKIKPIVSTQPCLKWTSIKMMAGQISCE